MLFPKMNGIVYPTFRIGSRTEAETMSCVPIEMKFRIYARRVQSRDPAFHHARGGYGVIKADHGKGRGIALRVTGMPGIAHDHGRRARDLLAAEGRRAVGAKVDRHARARRGGATSPRRRHCHP